MFSFISVLYRELCTIRSDYAESKKDKLVGSLPANKKSLRSCFIFNFISLFSELELLCTVACAMYRHPFRMPSLSPHPQVPKQWSNTLKRKCCQWDIQATLDEPRWLSKLQEPKGKAEGGCGIIGAKLILRDKGIITQMAAVAGGITCNWNGGMLVDLVYKIWGQLHTP